MAKWDPLTEFLRQTDQDHVELTLIDLEEVVGAPLPASARKHRSVFWSNAASNSYARIWADAGFLAQARGLPDDRIAFVRSEASSEVPAAGFVRPVSDDVTAVLVGCVKTKGSRPTQARALYRSALFARRRTYAETSGRPWVILSAQHGVVDPDQIIEPYDTYLEEQPAAYRRQWGQRVVDQLQERFAPLTEHVLEVHASAAYVEPIAPLLEAGGATVVWPFEGLRFGEHLAWYDARGPADDAGAGARGAGAPPRRRADRRQGDTLVGSGAGTGLARTITDAFYTGTLDLSGRPDAPIAGWDGMPEVRAVAQVRARGADDDTVRLFCTFVMAMDRARDADYLWERGTALHATDPWAYDPAAVVDRPLTALSNALRVSGVSQRHLPDAAAWRTIAESLKDEAVAPEVHRAVYPGEGDAVILLDAVARHSEAGTSLFPLLRGPKIAPVWIRILAYPGGADIRGLAELPVAVDVQVRKVSEHLDVTRTKDRRLEEIRALLQRVWSEDVATHGAAGPGPLTDTPAALDPALWFYGKWGCTRCEQAGEKRPISPVCAGCRFDELRLELVDTPSEPLLEDARQEADSTTVPPGRRAVTEGTARAVILSAAEALSRRGMDVFSPAQLIKEARRQGHDGYPDSTLRAHIVSLMCVNAPQHHAVKYGDLERVGRGQYRLHSGSEG